MEYWALKILYFFITLGIVTVYGLLLGATIARTMGCEVVFDRRPERNCSIE